MDAQDLIVNEGGDRKQVEDAATIAPRVGVPVLSLALVVESIYLSDLTRLVVAPQERDAIGPFCLQREQSGEGLEAVVAAVDKVPEEHVVGVWDLSAGAKELLKIVKLAMDVAADRDRRRHRVDVGLFEKQITNNITQFL